MKIINLTAGSYDDWVKLVFYNPVTSPVWYLNSTVTYKSDATTSLKYLRELFLCPEFLLSDLDVGQVEQGLWVICCSGGLLEEAFGGDSASFDIKKSVVESTYSLFEKLLKMESLRSIADMWWDVLTQALSCQSDADAQLFIGERYKEMQKIVYEVLCRILLLKSAGCIIGALHGLGHLQYPGTSITIEEFVKKNPTIDDEMLDYSRACVSGDIL